LVLMITNTSQYSVADCYHSLVIFFVHIHVKKSYEHSRKSEEEIYVATEYHIIVFCGGFVSTMLLLCPQ
jgi:hypothetical protein